MSRHELLVFIREITYILEAREDVSTEPQAEIPIDENKSQEETQ